MMKVVSACLAGIPCRYDGEAKPAETAINLAERGKAVLVCPEEMGGLPTPRPPAEIVGGDGEDVLAGRAKVLTADGTDVTEEYVCGARRAADVAQEAGASEALLKSKSPACGCSRIFDGTHTGAMKAGMGVFAAELTRRGISVEEV